MPGLVFSLSLAAVLSLNAAASDEQLPELRIQIVTGAGLNPEYSVSLERIHDRPFIRSAAPPVDGIWRFRDVSYGEYRMTVVAPDGSLVYEQPVTVNSQTSAITLSLPVRMRSPGVSGTISIAQLLHPIDRKAANFFSKSQKLVEKGDYEHAAVELEKAVAVSPAYADAYGNLAAVHIKMGRYPQALADVSRAIAAAGLNARDLSNQAIAYYHLEDYSSSIQAARWALRLDPEYDPAHFILGVSLATDKRTMPESVPHLEKAARTIARAKAILVIVQKTLYMP